MAPADGHVTLSPFADVSKAISGRSGAYEFFEEESCLGTSLGLFGAWHHDMSRNSLLSAVKSSDNGPR